MEGKLIKIKDNYQLYRLNRLSGPELVEGKLSLKNCEAIENGYYLDELAEESVNEVKEEHADFTFKEIYKSFFKEGFQKALELLGDKKFSDKDIDNFRKFQIQEQNFSKSCLDVWLKSLQQTEWDCVIFVDEKTKQPLLDNDGNLILKRK